MDLVQYQFWHEVLLSIHRKCILLESACEALSGKQVNPLNPRVTEVLRSLINPLTPNAAKMCHRVFVRLTPNDTYTCMRHGLRSRKLRFRGIPIMTGDVMVSGNLRFSPIYWGIPMPLLRKITMNNVCHFNGQYITQNSRLL